jgi:hypothetical protein
VELARELDLKARRVFSDNGGDELIVHALAGVGYSLAAFWA